jgi:hypothetical protein
MEAAAQLFITNSFPAKPKTRAFITEERSCPPCALGTLTQVAGKSD